MIPPYEFPNDAVLYATMNTHQSQRGEAGEGKVQGEPLVIWPCCNLII